MSAILKRKVLYLKVRFISPISVSSGIDEWTDSDVLRDCDDKPFISGSSIAGAMRAYLEKEKTEPCLMGYSKRAKSDKDKDEGRMSALFISDLTFDENPVFNIRDNVALNDNKVSVTENKFDIEILESGALGHFFMEIAIRENDDEEKMKHDISKIICGINAGEIRLGSKKTRGFGVFKVTCIQEYDYTKKNYLEYADAYDEKKWADAGVSDNRLEEWLKMKEWQPKQIRIEMPLQMRGGISIRQYAARKGEPDYVQLMDHNQPVIPGSSLAGAIRHRVKDILNELKSNGVEVPGQIDKIMDTAFGYVNREAACASNIIISESVIEKASGLTMTRTGVSRFESAAKQGALYQEKTYVNGTLSVKVSVHRSKNPKDERWIMGLLLMALKDMQNGFLAVGGQTAIGRGVFSANGPILIDGKEGKEDDFITNFLINMQ